MTDNKVIYSIGVDPCVSARTQELAFLNQLLTRERRGPGQLVLLYGRRRVGKPAIAYNPTTR